MTSKKLIPIVAAGSLLLASGCASQQASYAPVKKAHDIYSTCAAAKGADACTRERSTYLTEASAHLKRERRARVFAKAFVDGFARGVSRGIAGRATRNIPVTTYRGRMTHSDGSMTRWKSTYYRNRMTRTTVNSHSGVTRMRVEY